MLSVLFLSAFWLASSPTSRPGEILASLEPICQVICLRTCPLRIIQNKQSMAKEKLMSVYAWKADVSVLALPVCSQRQEALGQGVISETTRRSLFWPLAPAPMLLSVRPLPLCPFSQRFLPMLCWLVEFLKDLSFKVRWFPAPPLNLTSLRSLVSMPVVVMD